MSNFKCFEDQTLELSSLALLSGLNGMGKSSVLQSLLLLRQSHQQGLLPKTGLALNGDLVRLGTAKDALFENAQEEQISFVVTWDNEESGEWQFKYNREADVLGMDSEKISDGVFKTSLFGDEFHYLQAERIGPRTFFEISDYQVRHHHQLGTRGEFTAHFLSLFEKENIPNKDLAHPEGKSLQLLNQVEAWIGEVSPGTRIHFETHVGMDLVNLQYSFEIGKLGSSNPYRSTNVGFGITYTLPILVALLSAKPETLILLENPEAHLHPKGQARIGELIAQSCDGGVQILLETHSDHVLNGIRLAVHSGKVNPEKISLHYFTRKEEQGISHVISPKIDRNGRIDQWPDGFFDEWDKSLDALLEPKEK
jgi:predicted ATPase